MNLLHIDSSARATSVSRQLSSRFVEEWKVANPEGTVIERDLAATPLPHITDDWLATFGDPSKLTTEQRQYLSISDELISELLAADTVVIGAPMYNHMISWELKAWIDQVVRIGKTIFYDAKGPHGLLGGKNSIVITARGGSYPDGSARAALDFQEPYLRHILKTLGFSDISFIHADNLKAADPQASISAAIQSIQKAVVLRTNSETQNMSGAA